MIFLFYIHVLKMVYCEYSLELPPLGDFNENTQHTFMLKKIENISLLCLRTWRYHELISLNYPCLEHIFMVPKVCEPLKFYCISKLYINLP